MEIKVLDKGFIRLIGTAGSDITVVNSARVSYARSNDRKIKLDENDAALIERLIQNGHETPFENIIFTFHVKCPIFVARQWMRHRIASYNELSRRYKKGDLEFYIPSRDRTKDTTGDNSYQIKFAYDAMKMTYELLLERGVTAEVARTVLPVGLYTEFYYTTNLRSLMNFLKLRTDIHAQYEIRQYAFAIMDILDDIDEIEISWLNFKKKLPTC